MNKNLILKKRIQNVVPYLLIGLFALCLISPILIKNEFWSGYDTYFHMNTIYEDAMQIKTGHFSYFISLFGFERSGRIVNSLYGPILSYLLGALLLMCRSWIVFEFVLFFGTLVISGIGIYICARLLHLTKFLSTLLAGFYMISRPIVSMWLFNWEFTGLGATILLPYVLIVGIKIYRRRQIRILPLAIVMAVCLQIHLISSLIAVLVLLPLVLISFIHSSAKLRMVKDGVLAALISFCLSGNIFGAIYEIFSTNHVVPTFPNDNLQTISGGKSISVKGYLISDLWRLYTFMLIAVIIIMIIKWHSITTLDWILLFEDGFFLWLSSTYFPWNLLLKIWPKLSSIIQFPSRFIPIVFLLTLILLGRSVSLITVNFKWRIVIDVILILTFIWALRPDVVMITHKSQRWNRPKVVYFWVHYKKWTGFNTIKNGQPVRDAYRSSNLKRGVNAVHKVTSDYLPSNRRINMNNYYDHSLDKDYVKTFQHQYGYHRVTRNHEMMLSWQSRNNTKIKIPLVKYGNTVVNLNHKRIHPKTSIVGVITVKPRKGLNHVTIHYQPGQVFKLMSSISVFSWLIILMVLIRRLWIQRVSHEH